MGNGSEWGRWAEASRLEKLNGDCQSATLAFSATTPAPAVGLCPGDATALGGRRGGTTFSTAVTRGMLSAARVWGPNSQMPWNAQNSPSP